MQIKTNVVKNGGSLYLLVPPALIEYLSLEAGEDVVVIEDKEKMKGRYAVFWKV